MKFGRICASLLLFMLVFMCAAVIAAEDEGDVPITQQDMEEEIDRQLELLDLSGWKEYFDEVTGLDGSVFSSVEEMVSDHAKNGSFASADGLWGLLLGMLKSEFNDSVRAAVVLAFAALLTGLAGTVADGNIKPVLSMALCTAAILLVAAALSSLTAASIAAMNKAASFTQAVLPVMSALLASIGATASAGIFRPLMLFLSTTAITFIETIVVPLILGSGAFGILDTFTQRAMFGGLSKLFSKAAKWLLGLLSVLYFGVTALQGMTVSVTDGISIRTAKYAIDKLVPVVGSMVSGTVDSVMGCALIVKNSVGISAVLIMLGMLAGPMIRLMLGTFIFRVAAALAQPAADPNAVKLLGCAADTAGYLFAAVAAVGSMFAITIGIMLASGGVSAGIW